MAAVNLAGSSLVGGPAVGYELTRAEIDFPRRRLDGTVRLTNVDGETVKTLRLSGTFDELELSSHTVEAVSLGVITWLKNKSLLNRG